MKELLEMIATALVDNPDQVQVRAVEGEPLDGSLTSDGTAQRRKLSSVVLTALPGLWAVVAWIITVIAGQKLD